MKAGQLKELLKALERKRVNAQEISHLLEFTDDEIKKVLDLYSEKNSTFLVLLKFYNMYYEKGEEFEKDLKHLGISNLKQCMVDKIEHFTITNSRFICDSFENDKIDFSLFKNQAEYFRYLETLSKMKVMPFHFYGDLSWILKHEQCNRQEILVHFFTYELQSHYWIHLENYFIKLKGFSIDIRDFLKLLVKGYDFDLSFNTIYKWRKDIEKHPNPEFSWKIQLAMDCLLDFTGNCDNLPKVFLDSSPNDYSDIISLINEFFAKVSDHPSNVLDDYVSSCVTEDNRIVFNQIIQKFLNTDNVDVMESLWILLHHQYIPKLLDKESESQVVVDEMDDVVNTLKEVSSEHKSVAMARLLLRMPLPMWKKISNTASLENLELLFGNYALYIDRCIFNEKDESTYDMITKISQLSSAANQKILSLLEDNMCFLNDISTLENPEKRGYLLSTLFEKENEAGLDYVVEQYQQAEDYRQRQVEARKDINKNPEEVCLQTVQKLMGRYPIEDLLEGFHDDDEITPHTLIRSLCFKHSDSFFY